MKGVQSGLLIPFHLEFPSKWSPLTVSLSLFHSESRSRGLSLSFMALPSPSLWTPEQSLCLTYLLHHFLVIPTPRQTSCYMETMLHHNSMVLLQASSHHLELEWAQILSDMKNLHLLATACLHYRFQTLAFLTTYRLSRMGQEDRRISTQVLP